MNDLALSKKTMTASNNNMALDKLSGWRKIKDSIANYTITTGGMGVLMAILLIFFYLFYEIMPLFKSASIEEQHSYQSVQLEGESVFLAMEEQAEVALQVTDAAEVAFFKAQSGKLIKQQALALNGKVSSFALNSEQKSLFALGSDQGQVLLVQPEYKVSYPNDQRLITPVLSFPNGEQPLQFANAPIDSLAIRQGEEALVVVASVAGELVGRRWTYEEDFMTEEITLVEEELRLPQTGLNVKTLLIGPDQRWLYMISETGLYHVVDLNKDKVVSSGQLIEGGKVSSARFLLGGISLLVGSDRGELSQWFMVRESGKPARLEKIRSFVHAGSAIEHILIEHRRKGFVTIDDQQVMDIYHSTSERHLLSESISEKGIERAALSPRANALLVEHDNGELSFWSMYNKHPETSWISLWNKVWYESYSEPDYIWQSSASSNDFEPKYSFTPLAFGTLKAAFYAMLIATPLAICGAIYTAYFMSPGLRTRIKPLIELMEALPTVIIGFLAGLWLAPFVEMNLPGVFSILIFTPVMVLVFGFFWSQLPTRVRLLVPEGWHPVLLIPVIILVCWGCIALSAPVEVLLFEGDMRAWVTNDLGISFDQRNALVVGIAMGFAVIPTIFSIAEDAIFSVPKSLSYGSLALGATPWQTLVGVVIPTASPGIFSALMIGMGRAVGETMIVLMATGNTPVMDLNIFEGMRTLAANLAVEIGETEVNSTHYRVLFLAAFVLFMFTFVVNTAAEIVRQRLRKKYGSL
jgi:phosphate transport system permease protein